MCLLVQSCAVCTSNYPYVPAQKTKKKISRQGRRGSRARRLISDWPRQWEGWNQDLSLSSVIRLGSLAGFQSTTGAGWVWLPALSLWAPTMPGTLSNNGEKTAFLGMNKSFWKCFQTFGRTVWKYPLSICRFPSLFSYVLLSSTDRYCFLLNPFGSKILRITGFVSFDLGSCHSLTHVGLKTGWTRAQCSMYIVIVNEIISHQWCSADTQ